jgi:hypothetical protein
VLILKTKKLRPLCIEFPVFVAHWKQVRKETANPRPGLAVFVFGALYSRRYIHGEWMRRACERAPSAANLRTGEEKEAIENTWLTENHRTPSQLRSHTASHRNRERIYKPLKSNSLQQKPHRVTHRIAQL